VSAVHDLDCLGQRCPLPVIALARFIATVPAGDTVRVRADDPAAGNDIAAWCRMRGHTFAGSPAPDTFDVVRV
jgi:tRNA 2-thiouridine synthesizing protein A